MNTKNFKTDFYSFTNRPKSTPEINSGEILVETAGYVPAKRRIEDMINAGTRLVNARREQFDTLDDSEPDIDPTRSKHFDLAEATIYKAEVTRRFNEKKAVQALKTAVQAEIPPPPPVLVGA